MSHLYSLDVLRTFLRIKLTQNRVLPYNIDRKRIIMSIVAVICMAAVIFLLVNYVYQFIVIWRDKL